MTGLVYTNNAQSLLRTAIGVSDTTLTVYENEGFLFPDITEEDDSWFPLTLINPDDSTYEIVRATARDGDTITILRAQENTPNPSAFSEGTIVSLRMSAAGYDTFLRSGVDTLTLALGLNLAVQTNESFDPFKIFLEDVTELKDGLIVNFRPLVQLTEDDSSAAIQLNDFAQKQVVKAASPFPAAQSTFFEGDFKVGFLHTIQYDEDEDRWNLLSPAGKTAPARLITPGLVELMNKPNAIYDPDNQPERGAAGYNEFPDRQHVSLIIDDWAEQKGVLSGNSSDSNSESASVDPDEVNTIPAMWRWYGNGTQGEGFDNPITQPYGAFMDKHFVNFKVPKDQKIFNTYGTAFIRANSKVEFSGILIANSALGSSISPVKCIGPSAPTLDDFTIPTEGGEPGNYTYAQAPEYLYAQETLGNFNPADTPIREQKVLEAIRQGVDPNMFHGAHGYGYVSGAGKANIAYRGRSCIVMVAPEIIILLRCTDSILLHVATPSSQFSIQRLTKVQEMQTAFHPKPVAVC